MNLKHTEYLECIVLQFAIPYLFASTTVKQQLKQFAQAAFIFCTLLFTKTTIKSFEQSFVLDFKIMLI